jgi:hypothetical protein
MCTGPADCSGGQACASDGTWDACDCGGADASIAETSTGGGADASMADSGGGDSPMQPSDSASEVGSTEGGADGGVVAATCSVSGTADTCQHICEILYDCGLVWCGGTSQLCPGFDGSTAQRATFVSPDAAMGCVSACGPYQAVLASVIDPMHCDTTISAAKSAGASALGIQNCR